MRAWMDIWNKEIYVVFLQKYRYNGSFMGTSIWYHGSENVIGRPAFGVGNSRNDYGLGFYCTEHLELAKEWACAENRDGFANEYELDWEGLTVLDLSDRRYHILNWMAILLKNRTFVLSQGIAATARAYMLETFLPPYEEYDVIRGYRADDSYFSFASAFLNNTISLEQLGRAMALGALGEKIVLQSERAFGQIRFLGAVPAENGTYYPQRTARDRKARENFRDEKSRGTVLEETYIIDIVRNGWKNDDSRLRRDLP